MAMKGVNVMYEDLQHNVVWIRNPLKKVCSCVEHMIICQKCVVCHEEFDLNVAYYEYKLGWWVFFYDDLCNLTLQGIHIVYKNLYCNVV